MIRTQISLNDCEYSAVKKQAKLLGISIAEFVRWAITDALPPNDDAPWMKYAGFVETGNSRSSETVAEIVCGHND